MNFVWFGRIPLLIEVFPLLRTFCWLRTLSGLRGSLYWLRLFIGWDPSACWDFVWFGRIPLLVETFHCLRPFCWLGRNYNLWKNSAHWPTRWASQGRWEGFITIVRKLEKLIRFIKQKKTKQDCLYIKAKHISDCTLLSNKKKVFWLNKWRNYKKRKIILLSFHMLYKTQRECSVSRSIVPTFQENGLFMLGVMFCSVNCRRLKYDFLRKVFWTPLKRSTSWNHPIIFLQNWQNCQFGHALDYFMRTLKVLCIMLV